MVFRKLIEAIKYEDTQNKIFCIVLLLAMVLLGIGGLVLIISNITHKAKFDSYLIPILCLVGSVAIGFVTDKFILTGY